MPDDLIKPVQASPNDECPIRAVPKSAYQKNYADIEKALSTMEKFSDVEKQFEEVQKITHCSTGCGGCHDKIIDVISELLHA